MAMVATTLAIFLASVEARISFGRCPSVNYMKNFDPARYSGKWYEVVRDRTNPMTISTDCVTKEFGPFDASLNKMDLYFRGLYGWWMGYRGATGALWQCDEGSSDTFTCLATMGRSAKRSEFNIFWTDYDNVEIYYSCSRHWGFWKFETFAVSARAQALTQETYTIANAAIKQQLPWYDLDKYSMFYWTKQ